MILGRYHIEQEIGRGMMGIVYRAHDPALGRTVALKTVSLTLALPEGDRDAFEQRFLNEARAAAGLSHPGIVVVHDVGRDPDSESLYIALEHLEGRTLAEQVAAEGAPDWREALRLTARVAEALHHAHVKRVIHRDVKPANIMILPSGEPKLMDFGIAKVTTSQLTSHGEFFGTPSYMSPEQAAGEPLDGRSDIFSLGAVLYLLLTGQRAFDAASVPTILLRVAHHNPPPPTATRPDLPAAVDYLVARSLAKRADERYPTAGAFAEDIEDVRAGREPRHRAEWTPADVGGGTAVSPAPRVGVDRTTTEAIPAASAVAVAPAPALGAREGSLVLRFADRMGRRGIAALVLVLALGVTLPLVTRHTVTGVSTPSVLPMLGPPGRLEIAVEHPFRSGNLRVWVDDDLVIEEDLTGRLTRKVLSFRVHKGTLTQVLDVAPGEHVVRVEITGAGFLSTRRIRGTFKSGETRQLEATVDGLIKKELNLAWRS